MLRLEENEHVVIVEDKTSFLWADNDNAEVPGSYDKRYFLGETFSCAYEVKYGVEHSCLILASGGISTVHSRSALLHENKCIVAVGSSLVCLQLPDLSIVWHSEVHTATCFGVYHLPKYESYISHGELDIARVSYDGKIIWSSGGKDIFTNGFFLHDTYIEVLDFYDEKYHIDILTGRSEIIQS